jgi:hypothetical protein
VEAFARKLKEVYPIYSGESDTDLVHLFVLKYPYYRDRIAE